MYRMWRTRRGINVVVMEEGEMEGKECLGVSEQDNIPGHSARVPKSMCSWESIAMNQTGLTPNNAKLGVSECMCSLGHEWSGPVYHPVWRLLNTLFLFPHSSHLYASLPPHTDYIN